ncbi:helix-turn-helix domain-containing protein [Chitinophaga cymbidii]|uniref:HTH araC/xylS-type domain-containing protein n=1 Tax=Chitinophaga cymbidii TaxID=1096750 RepID=A0A512RFP7_9BACT|nr:helix-turn-helix transcriptional regulator [Chitinophaga cymbidii]GEP94522.1 hypothetical protein CCY01nite_07820 [Chitinophaga cymbidii]
MKLHVNTAGSGNIFIDHPVPKKYRKLLFPWLNHQYSDQAEGVVIVQESVFKEFSLFQYITDFHCPTPVALTAHAATAAIQFTISGSAFAEMTGGYKYRLSPNEAGIFFLGEGTNTAVIGDGLFRSIHFELSAKLLFELVDMVPELKELLNSVWNLEASGYPLYTIPINFVILELLQTLSSFSPSAMDHADTLKELVKDLLFQYKVALLDAKAMQALPPLPHKKTLMEIRNYISCYPSLQTGKLAWLSRHYPLSSSTISKYFQQLFEMPLSDFVLSKVMEKAHYQLRHTRRPIQQIAQELGYSSASNFTRAFIDLFGKPPSSLR